MTKYPQNLEASNGLYSGSSEHPFQANWFNIWFLGFFQVAGITLWPAYLIYSRGDVRWPEVVMAVFLYFFGVMGVTLSYHRSLSHLSYKMSPLFKMVTIFGASSTAEGSALAWCADHRRHHRFQDTPKDPYNVKRGFWWAHMGWMIGTPSTNDFSNIPDLKRDPFLLQQHRFYLIWLIGSSFLFPFLMGLWVGRPLQFLLLAGFTRLFVVQNLTFCINSWAHYFGRRPYSTNITARDSFLLAVLAQGEGWHNFHHRFPFDYRNGHKAYHYDSTKWVIELGRFLGLTSDLKATPAHEIFRAKIQTEREKHPQRSLKVKEIEMSLEQALARWRSFSLEMIRWKLEMGERRSSQWKVLKENLENARQEFRVLYGEWRLRLRRARPEFS